LKILLIDQDSEDFLFFKGLLPRDELSSSASLKEINWNGGFDLVILNIELMDPQAVLRLADLPLIVIGNMAYDHPSVLNALAVGAQDYLVKKEITAPLLSKSLTFSRQRHQIQQRLRDLSFTDPLTQLYNRRGFDQLLAQQISYAERHDQPFLLITLDINRFKSINDTFGHPIGDQALIDTAHVLISSFRKHDLVARIGGDEFAVIAPNTRLSEPLINHLLEGFAALEGRPYILGVSVGECLFDPQNPREASELVACADRKLYCCKKQFDTICKK